MRKLLVIILLLPILTNAQKNYPALLDNYMQAQAGVAGFSGIVLVAIKGKVIYEKAFGMANREWKVPNTRQSKFRIASVTKQFTAAAILQLAEKGSLALDDKLSKYFPDFPKGDSVTIHMLLNHTSGIKSYTNLPDFSSFVTLPYSKDSVLALFKSQPYEFTPGTKYNYNNSGYFLLGYIIEKVSGIPYDAFIYENLIKRAGLKNTFVNKLDSILADRVAGYAKTPTGWKNAEYISMEFPYSAGAIVSTAEDLFKWQNALFANKIISPDMFNKMITPYLDNYGYGVFIDSFQNRRRIAHSGGIPGFSSFLVRYPAQEISIVALSNGSDAYTVSSGLAAILFNLNVIPSYQHKEVQVSNDLLAKYAGKYRQNDSSVDTIVVQEGNLYLHPQEGPVIRLKADSETSFYLADNPNYYFQFEVDKKGKVIKSYFIQESGVKDEIKKL